MTFVTHTTTVQQEVAGPRADRVRSLTSPYLPTKASPPLEDSRTQDCGVSAVAHRGAGRSQRHRRAQEARQSTDGTRDAGDPRVMGRHWSAKVVPLLQRANARIVETFTRQQFYTYDPCYYSRLPGRSA